ncbi:hypothetical protein PYCCODRAFT_1360420 [Trametes coccinea BRFM310]|uniref:Uncharacterized protein n=1 Tax=Trametes coccinea (strain BRFM310) TaxID=1353009 RepID=A0A1Y2J367_TRAC3|nr:hypothetical protein PYCCODRAFT_1360420 [Trametes coccinea BRFM310]
MLSSASDPHTPPPRNSPLPMLLAASNNRKSSDSWNSSNYDGADDLEWEWKPEQTRLLSRTLDALPSHLLTPFNGPVPPSNLLDKIARGVISAKDPVEWPHSLRATRAKIVELARLRASEDMSSDTIAEEDSSDKDVLQQTTNTGPKRPLYRQSSMDFMQSSKLDPEDSSAIARLSYRLQQSERIILNPAHEAYARGSPRLRSRPVPSTPSSATLNSQSSRHSGSRIPRLQRSFSSISNSSDSYAEPAVDPRVQRIRRAESFAGSALYGPGSPLKRAPSYGSISKRNSDAMSVDCSNRSDVTSSDEEEKLRSKKAKKPRVKASSPTPPPAASPVVSPEKGRPLRRSTRTIVKTPSTTTPPSSNDTPRRATRPKANLKRNPSILGPELPPIAAQPSPARLLSPSPSPVKVRLSRRTPMSPSPASPSPRHTPTVTQTPMSSASRKTSRRKVPLPAGAVGRRISFGLTNASAGENAGPGIGLGLESAFQLD